MRFIADLHIHSKYSRATAKNLDLENLYHTAQIKGVTLVGTGDFTHPAWMEELETKLEPAEPGLFSLKKEFAASIESDIPLACRGQVRFILQTEISNIYKKDDRVRKNHNLIYMPDIQTAKRFNARLDAIGNIKSDGRPILGLDARNLLEIMLETSDQAFFIPAHIWTPWFSMFGSKSGFDTIEECFGDLSAHIFACETGLSSDPPMNWRVKDLDRVRLISNSDAHSPGYLGRNASVFDTSLDYWAVKKALETHDLSAFQGTLDMYPDQGKYHYDGHRKCKVRLNPDDTAALNGICPECGKPLTLGVLYRVRELADRPEGFTPENRHGHTYVVPLADILSEIFEVGPKTKKVTGYFNKAVNALGPELGILTSKSFEEIEKAGIPLLAEAVKKMRKGDLHIDPGFDGEYGKVNLFTRKEKEEIRGEKYLFFDLPREKKRSGKKNTRLNPGKVFGPKARLKEKNFSVPQGPQGLVDGLNAEQAKAVKSAAKTMLIQAGPGTGKTRTLTAKMAWLISDQNLDPEKILALTFTNKAAKELCQRIEAFMPQKGGQVMAVTFHGFCLGMLKTYGHFSSGLMEDDLRMKILGLAAQKVPYQSPKGKWSKKELQRMDHWIGLCKQQLLGPADDLSSVAGDEAGVLAALYGEYNRLCIQRKLVDFEDLIYLWTGLLMTDARILDTLGKRFSHIFVDEYQDLNLGQYELVKLLARNHHLFVIGDPDQSIYGFRGSDNRFFNRFAQDYPGCEQIRLVRNYRSTQTILDASFQMITTRGANAQGSKQVFSILENTQQVVIKEAPSESAEAVAVGKMIETLVGGLSFLSMETGRQDLDGKKEYAFSDFVVLYRTKRQCQAFIQAFEKAGIPFQTADRESWLAMEGIREALGFLRLIAGRAVPEDEAVLAKVFDKTRAQTFDPDLQSMLFFEDQDPGRADSLGLLEKISKAANLCSRIRDNDRLSAAWERLENFARVYPVPGDLLDALRLDQDQDLLDPGVEKVSLMTMHASKGLEFPVVFVTGCETGMIPYARDGENVEDIQEERRLFYVAMTRAMDILCLTYAKKRRIFGLNKSRTRSCFIDDIEKELACYEKTGRGRVKKKKSEIQLELF